MVVLTGHHAWIVVPLALLTAPSTTLAPLLPVAVDSLAFVMTVVPNKIPKMQYSLHNAQILFGVGFISIHTSD